MENIDTFLNRIERLLKSINLRLTQKRKIILITLFESIVPLSGVCIQNKLKSENRESVAIGTIYKILNVLSYCNVLHVLSLSPHKTKYYSIKNHKSQSYLVCSKCNSIAVFFDEVLEDRLKKKLQKRNFIVTNHRIVLYGLCKRCR